MALRVFVVDDSPPVRQRLEAMLAGLDGARLLGSADGADAALREILALRPEVVLLDLKLAQGSGFDVLKAVRAAVPEIDVYMLSNFATPAYRRAAARLGARGFFDKTAEFQDLLDLLAARARP